MVTTEKSVQNTENSQGAWLIVSLLKSFLVHSLSLSTPTPVPPYPPSHAQR